MNHEQAAQALNDLTKLLPLAERMQAEERWRGLTTDALLQALNDFAFILFTNLSKRMDGDGRIK